MIAQPRRNSRNVLVVVLSVVLACLGVLARPAAADPAPSGTTELTLYDKAGVYPLGSAVRTWTPANSTFSWYPGPEGVTVMVSFPSKERGLPADRLLLEFSASAETLATGTYTDTTTDRPSPSSAVTLDVTGMGRACNAPTGTFTVSELDADPDASRGVLAATFEFMCDTTPVYGSVAFRSSGPAPLVPHAPPGLVRNIKAVGKAGGTVALSWENPKDIGVFAAVMVRRFADVYGPGAPDEGDPVYVGSASSFTATGLNPGTTYSFSFFPRNPEGTYGPRSAVMARGTNLGLGESPIEAAYGTTISLTGVLNDYRTNEGIAGMRVDLARVAYGGRSYTTLAHTITGKDGGFTFTAPMTASAGYRVSFSGAEGILAASPLETFVTVVPRVTAKASKPSGKLGTTFTIATTVTPVLVGPEAQLQRSSSGKWKTVGKRKLTKTGVSFPVKPTAKGTYNYRVYVPGGAASRAATSGKVAVKAT